MAACVLLVLLDRWLVLERFSFRYIDDDQTIMWNAAEEMAHGRFHEPFFYGQRYNTMLEGLLAVPLLWAGLGHERALPLVTASLALFPYFMLAALAYRDRRPVQTALILVVPIALPVEFGLVSSMPRGFVTGVCLASFSVVPLFPQLRMLLAPCAFLATLAWTANPNAALLLAPVLVLLAFRFRGDRRAWLHVAVGAIPGLALRHLANTFYDARPEYVVHREWPLDFDLQRITLQAVDLLLGQATPFFWGHGGFLVLILLGLGAWLWTRRHREVAAFLLLSAVVLVAAIGVNKVNDGMPTVFYSWTRMFIGAPVLVVIALALVPELLPRWSIGVVGLASGALLGLKVTRLPIVIEVQVHPAKEKNLHVMALQEVKTRCAKIHVVAMEEKADLLVLGWLPTKHMMNYGCPCLIDGFPETVQPDLDRRTWKLKELERVTIDRILLDGFDAVAFADRLNGRIQVIEASSAPPLLLITGPSMGTGDLLDSLGLGMRNH